MSEKEKYNQLEAAIKGGVVGATLAALFTGRSENLKTGALIGAAIAATYTAFLESSKTDAGVLVLEKNAIYRVFSNGKKQLVEKLSDKPYSAEIPDTFALYYTT